MPARKWSKEELAEGLDLSAKEGSQAAAEATGIPAVTLRQTARRASAGVDLPAEVRSQPWSRRRPHVVQRLGEMVDEVITATQAAIGKGDLRSARDGAVTVGILIDKAQLLDGGATWRGENATVTAHVAARPDVAEQLAALRVELGYSDPVPALPAEDQTNDEETP